RREGRRGRLIIERIAGKDFTTLRHIQEMRKRCRDQQKVPDSGSSASNATQVASSSAGQLGSSGTDRAKSTRAALETTARVLNGRSPNTSRANTGPTEPAAVIPVKSS